MRDPATNKASHANPKCLRPLNEVLDFLEERPTWGIGFSFHFDKPWPLVGIDLDDCREAETGQLTEFARGIADSVNSYAETSVISGRIVMYENIGYFVFT